MIKLDEFKQLINEENLDEMKKLQMPAEWAYKEYINMLDEKADGEVVEVNEGVKAIINEYIEGLLYREFNKYELDWE